MRFCGIVLEPPRPGACGSNASTDFGLHQQDDVGRELRKRTAGQRDRACGLRERAAIGVPRRVGDAQRELAAERARDLATARTERGQRSDGAAELQDAHALPRFAQPPAMLAERREPQRAGVAEGDRKRVLQVRPSRHRIAAVPSRERGERGDRRVEIGFEQRETVLHLQDVAVSSTSCVVAPQCT